MKSAAALIGFIVCVWHFQPWMIPFLLLIPLLKKIIFLSVTGGWQDMEGVEVETLGSIEEVGFSCLDQDLTFLCSRSRGTRRGLWSSCRRLPLQFRFRFRCIYYRQIDNLQENLGGLASFLESIKNTFNFSIPFLSWLALVVLLLLTVVLYLLPLRYVMKDSQNIYQFNSYSVQNPGDHVGNKQTHQKAVSSLGLVQ